MIIRRLYELAEREGLMEDPAFETLPVPYVVKLGPSGAYLGIEERRGEIAFPPRKKGAPPKKKPDKGKVLSAPTPHGSPANKGFARFFVDTLQRVLPVSDDEKSVNSRQTFWEQIGVAASETDDDALLAVQKFGENLVGDANLAARVSGEVEAVSPNPGDRCTFAWHPDGGNTIIDREPLRQWYRMFFSNVTKQRQTKGSQGLCQVTGEFGPLANAHTTKIKGILGGMGQGVSLVSNDKPAFESYSLDKAVNACIGYEASDGYTRALNALVGNKLPGRPKTCVRVGNVTFLFWTRDRVDTDDLMQLDQPHSEQVAKLIASVGRGRATHTTDPDDFYCLSLSGNAARAVVRDYLELPLPQVRINLGLWFRDLCMIDEFAGQPTAVFPLWSLARATVRDEKDIPPHLPPNLMQAALKGTPVASHVLSACLRRLHVETDSRRFRPERMGLIKLILNRQAQEGDLKMSEQLDFDATERSPGYACGRLLALLARCQSASQDKWDFGAGAQILERYYGAASMTPRAIFPVLLRLSRHHLKKIRDEMPGFAFNLEQELEERMADFKKTPEGDPNLPAILSLTEQGRFALGYYHQRAQYRAASAERKAQEEAAAKSGQ